MPGDDGPAALAGPNYRDAGLSSSRMVRFVAFLRMHPILCLAILTPGIPEYLSSSSAIQNIVLNPVWFFVQLAVNVGQYTAGALLIREALIRWRKGWVTAALLALAYGITEEGLGDNTLFNSNNGADGVLGSFGRFAGVNWVWSTGVLSFHVVYSIGLPILLLGLALPRTRGRSLLGPRGIVLAFLSVIASTSFETVFVYRLFHFWMGIPLLVGSLAAISVLVVVAYRTPAGAGRPRSEGPLLTSRTVGTIGFAVFPALFFLEYYVPYFGVPAPAIVALEIVFLVSMVEVLLWGIGRVGNEYLMVNLACGFILWQCVFGLLVTLPFPFTLPLIVVAVLFLIRLRRAYATTASPVPPPGAVLGA